MVSKCWGRKRLLKQPMGLKQRQQTKPLHLYSSSCYQCSNAAGSLVNAADTPPGLSQYAPLLCRAYCLLDSITRLPAGAGPLPAEFPVSVPSEVKERNNL